MKRLYLKGLQKWNKAVVLDTIDENVLPVFGLGSAPYGITYAEWTDKWQEWAPEIPKDSNQISDVTGRHIINDNMVSLGP
jgi:hypothetical protein